MSLSKTATAIGSLGLMACAHGTPVTPQNVETQDTVATSVKTVGEMRAKALGKLGGTNEGMEPNGNEFRCIFDATKPDSGPRDEMNRHQAEMAAQTEYLKRQCPVQTSTTTVGDSTTTRESVGGTIMGAVVTSAQEGNVTCAKIENSPMTRVICEKPLQDPENEEARRDKLLELKAKALKKLNVNEEGPEDFVETRCAVSIVSPQGVVEDWAKNYVRMGLLKDGCSPKVKKNFNSTAPRIATETDGKGGFVVCAQLPLRKCEK